MSSAEQFLNEYVELGVSEGWIEQHSITPSDCKFIVEEIIRRYELQREFAV